MISAIIISLLIALATIVITIQQNKLNKANRANDIDIAQKQREKNLLIYNTTREQDRELNTQQPVLRQLDGNRKTNVILFLLESGLLTSGKDSISLVGGNLNGFQLDIEEDSNNCHSYLFYLVLLRTSLANASFQD
ncbi:unnamed protein product [Rotaria sp. Silwood1]|nr:unnamed protein product [Rotaria sp. Silwood1]CAF1620993.1 unnamed protein product [Rotaria sp. Silwood1]CAF3718161.1 unnamed protein product [Rotaria sp. Silwood1]CAF3795203.1 unnamed protein product [Rotaria sp. Silwood1]CAF5132942.1 unnamed protein product [Rotaria sp. Silwood1]